jgi:sortase (surface protein transpeptidase)
VRTAFDESEPVRLQIPSIGVDANFQRLNPGPDGVLPPPTNNRDVGWWADGPEPGEPGAAVVAGHVDSKRGPAVLFDLRKLKPGAEVLVTTADATTVRFMVDSVERFPKAEFPTERVYTGSEPGTAQLRLVTCGGAFNHTSRHYKDNVIAFATLGG